MPILRNPVITVALGALPLAALALLGNSLNGERMADRMEERAARAIAKTGGAPVQARFTTARGWPTRHPVLSGGEGLDEGTRNRIAHAVSAIPGVGGIAWTDGTALAESSEVPLQPLHCQEDVEALLQARTIRFEEGSSRLDPASQELIGEVATALRPCLGSIIAVTGHTDASGSEAGNIQLSRSRAAAVQAALVGRGIPDDGLRARGVGSREPVEGLEAEDPANRRIEFSVIATQPIHPTPVDTPGPR